MAWPSIATPSGIVEFADKGQIKVPFEGGYVQSVAKYSRMRRMFELTWNAMSAANKATLITYFENNQGTTFSWTHPHTSTAYTVRFRDDQLMFTYDLHGKSWVITVALEEQ